MGHLTDQTVKLQNSNSDKDLPQEFRKFDKPFGLEPHIWWIVTVALVHPACIYYLFYLLPFGHVPAATFLLGAFYTYLGGLGITMGAHRYWTHRAFKAKLPLQIILMIWQTISFHNPIFKWCKEHRVHHKYTDTDADPHNINRGFWFAHIGWLLEPRHPKCVEKLKTIDMSDLIADPVVRFQSKYYYELSFLFAFLIPISHCRWLFPETSLFHILIWNMTTFSVSLNAASCVNSVAHMWGDKPYDKNIKSTDNSWVSIYAVGEGWHNYHHTFPWDYKASELGWKWNLSTIIIDFFAWIGWAYDLKTTSHKVLVDRIIRTGDGSHSMQVKNDTMIKANGLDKENNLIKNNHNTEHDTELYWGWGDKDLKSNYVEVSNTQICAG